MIAMSKLPSQEKLELLLTLDRTSGRIYWKARSAELFIAGHYSAERKAAAWNSRYAGQEAFTAVNVSGYRHGGIDGKLYLAHRVVWKMMTGADPLQIDHINGERTDNRPQNLRSVDATGNARNQKLRRTNQSGAPGVILQRGKWLARIWTEGRNRYLGTFDAFEDAVAKRKQVEAAQGDNPNRGRISAGAHL
tara:strand:+ start:173 stop:748 length:576 start_codon:yes stop_codon:yes gene_type:complete